MLKIRRSRDGVILNMRIPILVRRHINIETPPWYHWWKVTLMIESKQKCFLILLISVQRTGVAGRIYATKIKVCSHYVYSSTHCQNVLFDTDFHELYPTELYSLWRIVSNCKMYSTVINISLNGESPWHALFLMGINYSIWLKTQKPPPHPSSGMAQKVPYSMTRRQGCGHFFTYNIHPTFFSNCLKNFLSIVIWK